MPAQQAPAPLPPTPPYEPGSEHALWLAYLAHRPSAAPSPPRRTDTPKAPAVHRWQRWIVGVYALAALGMWALLLGLQLGWVTVPARLTGGTPRRVAGRPQAPHGRPAAGSALPVR